MKIYPYYYWHGITEVFGIIPLTNTYYYTSAHILVLIYIVTYVSFFIKFKKPLLMYHNFMSLVDYVLSENLFEKYKTSSRLFSLKLKFLHIFVVLQVQ